MIRVESAERNDRFNFSDADFSTGCRWRIEIASRLSEDKVAGWVAPSRLDDCNICDDSGLENVTLAVEIPVILTIRENADTHAEAGYTGTTGRHEFGVL